jgi:hypothetical protein
MSWRAKWGGLFRLPTFFQQIPGPYSQSVWRAAVLPALLAMCIVRLWLMPLPSSFWLDEMVTVFVTQHGAADPSLAVAPQVANSIYYELPRVSQALFGPSEIAYRLPSLLAMALALFLAARLAARLIHPRAGWLAAFACLALSGFDYQAADARPYALGTCVTAACVWALVRWLDSARWQDGMRFALFAVLLLRIHLVYWPLYLVFAAYAAVRLARRETRVGWPMVAAIGALIGAALIRPIVSAFALFREAEAHVITAPPTLHVFEHELRWSVVVICAAAAWLLSRFPKPAIVGQAGSLRRVANPPADLLLILAWWLAPPICLFAFSLLTGNSVFVRRYLSEMLPAVGLAATAAAARFLSADRLNRLAAILGVGALIFLGQWTQFWPAHEHSNWRAAAAEVNRITAGSKAPVICPSPFIEAKSPVWRPDYPLPGFLYSHLPVYPIAGATYLFPFENSPVAANYALSLASGPLSAANRFVIYGFNEQVNFWRDWFAPRPEFAGWKRTTRPFGDVEVVTFEK